MYFNLENVVNWTEIFFCFKNPTNKNNIAVIIDWDVSLISGNSFLRKWHEFVCVKGMEKQLYAVSRRAQTHPHPPHTHTRIYNKDKTKDDARDE